MTVIETVGCRKMLPREGIERRRRKAGQAVRPVIKRKPIERSDFIGWQTGSRGIKAEHHSVLYQATLDRHDRRMDR